MHTGQNYGQPGYVPSPNQRMALCPQPPMNGPMTGHINSMGNQMHNSGMMNNSNGMTPSMAMNGPMSMNKGNMQTMGGMPGPQSNMYPGTGGPRTRPAPYTNPQQYLSQKRQYNNNGGVHTTPQYNSAPVMQSYGPVSQPPYNSNQVRN